MAEARETDRNLYLNKLRLSEKEIDRLETMKVDKGWIKGKLEVHMTKISAAEKKIEEVRNELDEMANVTHECLHKNTLANIQVDVSKSTKKVEEWDKLMRRAITRGSILIISTVVTVAGSLVVWLVMHNNLSNDVSTLEDNNEVDRATLSDIKLEQATIKTTIKAKKESEIKNIKKAFRDTLREMQKENKMVVDRKRN
jgi:hypothetical protein